MVLSSLKAFATSVGNFFKTDPYIAKIEEFNREQKRCEKGETTPHLLRLEAELQTMERKREAKRGLHPDFHI